jgi:hypothetical protein
LAQGSRGRQGVGRESVHDRERSPVVPLGFDDVPELLQQPPEVVERCREGEGVGLGVQELERPPVVRLGLPKIAASLQQRGEVLQRHAHVGRPRDERLLDRQRPPVQPLRRLHVAPIVGDDTEVVVRARHLEPARCQLLAQSQCALVLAICSVEVAALIGDDSHAVRCARQGEALPFLRRQHLEPAAVRVRGTVEIAAVARDARESVPAPALPNASARPGIAGLHRRSKRLRRQIQGAVVFTDQPDRLLRGSDHFRMADRTRIRARGDDGGLETLVVALLGRGPCDLELQPGRPREVSRAPEAFGQRGPGPALVGVAIGVRESRPRAHLPRARGETNGERRRPAPSPQLQRAASDLVAFEPIEVERRLYLSRLRRPAPGVGPLREHVAGLEPRACGSVSRLGVHDDDAGLGRRRRPATGGRPEQSETDGANSQSGRQNGPRAGVPIIL